MEQVRYEDSLDPKKNMRIENKRLKFPKKLLQMKWAMRGKI